jgi:Leucine-rich repeat (LRR) protein
MSDKFKMYSKHSIIFLIIICSTNGYAQNKCITSDPGDAWNTSFNGRVQQFRNTNNVDIVTNYTIPVIVHILHNGDQVGDNENISLAQVQSQINGLNVDYSGTNSDAILIPQVFQQLQAGNTGIQFCLAKFDPNGNLLAEEGIERINWQTNSWTNPNSFQCSEQLKSYFNGTIKLLTRWDPTRYLNIWVAEIDSVQVGNTPPCNGGGVFGGYAPFPKLPIIFTGLPGFEDENTETDITSGLVINYKAFGVNIPSNYSVYNLGRVAAHELGHYFGLLHTFRTSNNQSGCEGGTSVTCATEGDYCCDTPPTSGNLSTCPSSSSNQNTCVETPVDKPDMTMNYMNYVHDACMYMFTIDQRTRIQTAMEYGIFRAPLANSNACCPAADLIIVSHSVSPVNVTGGNTVTASFIERNTGNSSAGPNYVNFYISQDDVLTPGANGDIYLDQYLVNQTIGPQLQTSQLTKQLTIPASTASGPFYILFSADATGGIAECSEINNVSYSQISINQALPDLILNQPSLSPSVPVNAGTQMTATFKIKNQGLVNADASVTKFWLSKDLTLSGSPLDIDLNSDVAIPALNPGQTSAVFSPQLTIPAGTEGGTWYVVFDVDGNSSVAESDESNNRLFSQISVISPASTLSDSLILVAFYNATGGPNWTNHTNWLTLAPLNTWYGISINGSRRVTSIILNQNNLTGTIPNSLNDLTSLIYLYLGNNQLTGSIPNFTITTLEFLDLGLNQLTGGIPSFSLPALKLLYTSNNPLGGSFPGLNLPALTNLAFYNNQLSGTVPDLNFPNLVYLNLNKNQLSGSLPNCNIPLLKTFDLSENQFTGSIPFYTFPLMERFHVQQNQLTGAIPDFNFPNLIVIFLSDNQLSGTIPAFSFPVAEQIQLQTNLLTGEIPSAFNDLTNLTRLGLSNNQLSGTIPSLNNLVHLTAFDITNNKFTFNGLEPAVQQFSNVLSYSPQANIPLHSSDCKLSVSAGGTLANNTYKWYKDALLVTTIIGDSTYTPVVSGDYSVQVTNAIATQLTLYSDIPVNFQAKPELGPAKLQLFCPLTYADISHLFDDVLNIHPEYSIIGWFTLSGIHFDSTLATYGNTYMLIVQNASGCRDTGIVNTGLYPIKNILPAQPQTVIAFQETAPDAFGWTHYYSSSNQLLLSIKKNGNNIGTVGDGTFQVKVGATFGAGSGSAILINNPLFTNASGSYIMNRYWNVTATNQPASSVGIRYYFNTQDFADMQGSVPGLSLPSQMQFYKLYGGNPDPATNFAGATDITNITNGTLPSTTKWVYTSLGCNEHQAEFNVDNFSGGGGGATINGNPFAIPVVPPTISAISPATAMLDATVTITGTKFTGTTAVSFGGTAASSFTVVSPNTILAVVGQGTSGNVSVTTPAGTALFPGFNYIAPPVITSFSPSIGPVGTTVIFTGLNFSTTLNNNTVYFGAVKANVLAATTTSLTVTVPAGANYQPISITTNNLTAYSKKPFTVIFPGGGTGFTASSFAPKVDNTTGSFPVFVTGIDLNADSKADLVLPNYGNADGTSVSVLKNNSTTGIISFAGKVDFPTGSGPWSIAAGDLDGDGKPDLVIANESANTISLLRNTSTGGVISFDAKIDIASGNMPESVFISDLDADGKPDIAVTNIAANTISVFKNKSAVGLISFNPKSDFVTGIFPESLTVADLDGDTKPDIIIANQNSNTISVLRNTGSVGTVSFAAKIDFSTGLGPWSVAAGDFDRDGKIDLAAANNTASSVSILRNTGSAGTIAFAAKVDAATGTSPIGISICDLDGDGKADIATSNETSSLSVLRNSSSVGSLSFYPKVNYIIASGSYGLSVGDIDGDGKPDLVAANSLSSSVSTLRNKIGEAELCANGTTAITSATAGSSYQWQVNTGSGFVNISDNANYAGTNTSALQLYNIPSSWYGYQYRCLVNAVPGTASVLKISSYWMGIVSSAWENPQNWSCGVVPDANSDVIINNGTVVVNSNTSCRSLTARPGVSVTVTTGSKLTIIH